MLDPVLCSAALHRCLQDNKGDKAFGKPCLEEVQRYEMEISRDYRLNYRLRTACQKDIQVGESLGRTRESRAKEQSYVQWKAVAERHD